jgi:hypothetical protein
VLEAVTKCDYGDLLMRRGDHQLARLLGAEAELLARDCGLGVLAERAARLAGALTSG